MILFLISLAVLFVAGIVGYVVIRVNFMRSPDVAWPSDVPPLPWILLLSTAVLIVSSCTLHAALTSAREDQLRATSRLMLATTLLGVLFLVMQYGAWTTWFAGVSGSWEDSQPHRWALASFYVLTGIHAAHVLGGIVPLLIATVKSFKRRYSSSDFAGIYYCAMYWHFLGVVWIVLYLTLAIGN